jgi:hypothetical protein
MKHRIAIGAALAVFMAMQWMVAQNSQQNPPLGLSNIEMSAKLLSPISTMTSQPKDIFSAQVVSPEPYIGAVLEGHISSIKAAKNRNKAEISFQFETFTFRGVTYPIQADLKEVANSQGVKNVDEEGRAIGKSSNKKTLESALIGAAAGGILGGVVGGAKGAAAGAVAGTGVGLLFAIKFTTSGSQMEFSPGAIFTLAVSDRSRQ